MDDNSDVDHGVWVMNADGSDVHQIVPDPGAGHVTGLAWSPAGDRIALGFGNIYTFASASDRGQDLLVAPPDQGYERVSIVPILLQRS